MNSSTKTSIQTHSATYHPGWLRLAQLAWILLTAASIIIWVLGLAEMIRDPFPVCLEASCDPMQITRNDLALLEPMNLPTSIFAFINIGGGAIAGLVYLGVAFVIAAKKWDDGMALLASYVLIYLGMLLFTNLDDLVIRAYPGSRIFILFLLLLGQSALLLFFFLFPNGKFSPSWMKWPGILTILLGFFFLIWVRTTLMDPTNSQYSQIYFLLSAALFPLIGFSQVYRYRVVSSPIQRQQTKWVVLGILASILLMILWDYGLINYPAGSPSQARLRYLVFVIPLFAFLSIVLPVTIAFSTLRYRLFDIDLIVRRTLVYTLLTATLVLVYFGVVTLLQSLFSSLTGQQSPLAVVISTLVIAALFNPLRQRLQNFIDRRFFRQKYDVQQAIETFAATARDSAELDQLTAELVQVTVHTMQPTGISLWLKSGENE